MENFLKRKCTPLATQENESGPSGTKRSSNVPKLSTLSCVSKEVDLENLPDDPGNRPRISFYHPNQRDEIRRAYWLKGPHQPREYDFPSKMIGKYPRRFNPDWFDHFRRWLEYSIKEDKAYCLCCYLCRDQFGKQGGSEAFVTEGFSCWNKTERLASHVGNVKSAHNYALKRCEDLVKQKQSIEVSLNRHSDILKEEYRIRLNASIDVARILLHQGLPFRGHDESEDSENRGNFLELLKYTGKQNDQARNVILKNAPKNHQMIAPDIQKDIVHCFCKEIVNIIIADIGDDFFGLLVDESSDISNKEQMSVVLRYVDKHGLVKERFVGIVHVKETSAQSLKDAIDMLFAKYGLTLSKVRGQGYDGAINMRGEFKGLKTLILNESKAAYYVHCFAHQLQLALVSVAKSNLDVVDFFSMISTLLNVVGASCKRRDMIREHNMVKVKQDLMNGVVETGTGLNQELSLKRPGDTRWGSHYKSLMNLFKLYESIIEVLEYVRDEGMYTVKRSQARGVLRYFQSFEFVFFLHLMIEILGITNELSNALQRKDQDIMNAVSLVKVAKRRLEKLRVSGWESLLEKITSFCDKYGIRFMVMEEQYVNPDHPRRKSGVTNLYHFRVLLFSVILDEQLAELNRRFDEVNTELLLCVACLSPNDSFCNFNASKLVRLAQFYPDDFSNMMELENQLETYIDDVSSDERFSNINGLAELSKMLVDTKKNLSFPLVFRLLKLTLILPVATASVERSFSAMNIVKTYLRNRMGDKFLNDCIVSFIEKDILDIISNEIVITRFSKYESS